MNAPLIESTRLSAASLAMIRQLVSLNTTSRESNRVPIGADSAIAELERCCNLGAAVFNKVSFGAEASLFHNAGIPAILCGPGHIALGQVARCEAFLRRLVDQISIARP